MRENILNMPHHLRRQRVVTAEQAAMAMAGVYSCSRLDELKAKFPPEIYNIASSYLRIILSAVNAEELHPREHGLAHLAEISLELIFIPMIFGLGLLKKYQLQIVGLDVIQIALAKSTSLYEACGASLLVKIQR